MLSALMLSGLFLHTLLGQQAPPRESWEITKLITSARQHLGTPFGQDGLDCSLLVQKSYKDIGISLERNSRQQSKQGVPVSAEHVKRGDLVFFNMEGKIGHVGIVVSYPSEPLRFIHITKSKGVTETLLMDSYWKKRFAFARRVLGSESVGRPISFSLADHLNVK